MRVALAAYDEVLRSAIEAQVGRFLPLLPSRMAAVSSGLPPASANAGFCRP
jgi:hypothetical protein